MLPNCIGLYSTPLGEFSDKQGLKAPTAASSRCRTGQTETFATEIRAGGRERERRLEGCLRGKTWYPVTSSDDIHAPAFRAAFDQHVRRVNIYGTRGCSEDLD